MLLPCCSWHHSRLLRTCWGRSEAADKSLSRPLWRFHTIIKGTSNAWNAADLIGQLHKNLKKLSAASDVPFFGEA
jgi:hypothetical protein